MILRNKLKVMFNLVTADTRINGLLHLLTSCWHAYYRLGEENIVVDQSSKVTQSCTTIRSIIPIIG